MRALGDVRVHVAPEMVVYPAVSRAHLLRYRAVQGLELINNALKHAFPDGMKGVLTVSFTVSNNNYIAEFKDDGIGIAQGQAPDGFGTRSVADIARLMGGSLTCQPARQSSTRPGTMWRLVIPA